MRVYISGQITGLPQREYEQNFADAAEVVLGSGHEAVNPVEIEPDCSEGCGSTAILADGSYKHKWNCYMKADIIAMMTCDAVLVLSNWINSKGATVEVELADAVGIPIYALKEGEMRRVASSAD